jgi:hypothetical protein
MGFVALLIMRKLQRKQINTYAIIFPGQLAKKNPPEGDLQTCIQDVKVLVVLVSEFQDV